MAKFEIDVEFSRADASRLCKAGLRAVVRWVDYASDSKSDRALKTLEALTLLDRREESAKKKAAK